MPTESPPPRVAAEAAALEFGAFERRSRRRPGIPGVVVCVAMICVGGNFLRNGPHNALVVTGLILAALIILWWAYLWIRRTGGGLYVFAGGFIDAAGLRLISVAWSDISAVKTSSTRYSLNLLPIGTTLHYTIVYREGDRDFDQEWELNTTYADVTEIGTLIAERAGVTIQYVQEP